MPIASHCLFAFYPFIFFLSCLHFTYTHFLNRAKNARTTKLMIYIFASLKDCLLACLASLLLLRHGYGSKVGIPFLSSSPFPVSWDTPCLFFSFNAEGRGEVPVYLDLLSTTYFHKLPSTRTQIKKTPGLTNHWSRMLAAPADASTAVSDAIPIWNSWMAKRVGG